MVKIMTLNEAIEICQARIDLDRNMRNNKVDSDYEKFCENECMAIERLIEEYKNKKENPPLTIKELKQMRDKPVFIHWSDDYNTKEWGFVSISSNDKINIIGANFQVDDVRMSGCRIYRYEIN